MNEVNNVVYITDENYAMPTCVSIQSIVENNLSETKYQITVLAFGLSAFSIQKLTNVQDEHIKVVIREMESDFSELYSNSVTEKRYVHVSEVALCKFELPNIFLELDNILYMDSDIIINKDMTTLFKNDITEYYLAAVDDMGDEYEHGVSMLASRIGIPERRYFNSGFMYLNLRKMREENVTEQLIEYKHTGINYFVDQDSLNVVLGEKRLPLSYTYNFRTPIIDTLDIKTVGTDYFGEGYETVEECLREKIALHMTDKLKPWKYNIPWISDIFQNYYNKSPYGKQKLVLKSPLMPLNNKIKELSADIETWSIVWHDLKANYIRKKEECARKVWRFPFDSIPMHSKIVLYGAGNVGQDFRYLIEKTNYCQIVAWVDKNFAELGEEISSPERVKDLEYDYVLVAISNEEIVKKVEKYLVDMGVEQSKIVAM